MSADKAMPDLATQADKALAGFGVPMAGSKRAEPSPGTKPCPPSQPSKQQKQAPTASSSCMLYYITTALLMLALQTPVPSTGTWRVIHKLKIAQKSLYHTIEDTHHPLGRDNTVTHHTTILPSPRPDSSLLPLRERFQGRPKPPLADPLTLNSTRRSAYCRRPFLTNMPDPTTQPHNCNKRTHGTAPETAHFRPCISN